MATFPYRVREADAVAALVERLRADRDLVAAALLCVGAHGFSMEIEMLQRDDGTFVYSSWNDVQGNISVEDRTFALDLVPLVVRARGLAGTRLEGAGRRVLVALADRQGGYWIDAAESGAPELAELFAVVFR
jgi:hypothetical protein